MTEPGETEGYTVSDHIRELFRHARARLFDMCLVNTASPPPELIERYGSDGSSPIVFDEAEVKKLGVEAFAAPFAEGYDGRVRHNPDYWRRRLRHMA
jgi:2-phospho-L-lactate transferase/gluconeogenesis factor (CofD/UPF0052 family)